MSQCVSGTSPMMMGTLAMFGPLVSVLMVPGDVSKLARKYRINVGAWGRGSQKRSYCPPQDIPKSGGGFLEGGPRGPGRGGARPHTLTRL